LDLGADALIETVVADFETAEGRSTARDGLKENIGGVRVSEVRRQRSQRSRVRSNWRHDPVRARSKQVVASKSKRIRSMSRLMPHKDDDPSPAGDTLTQL
jgi:hypothetical protein